MNDEELTRKALHDAVSDVHPEHRFAEIGEPRGRSRWPLVALASAAAVVVVIGGVLFAQRGGPGPATPAANPTVAKADQAVDVTVYFIHKTAYGPRIYPVDETLTGSESTKAQTAVNAALSIKPDIAGNSASPFPAGTEAKVTGRADDVTVDLHGTGLTDQPAGYDADNGAMAIQALVWSATEQAGDKVTFTIDGKPTDTLLGEPVTAGMTRGNPEDTLPRVVISSPRQGATVDGTFTVSGQGSAFEANLVWSLRTPEGNVVKQGHTTAKECCKLAPFSFDVTGVPAGTYTLDVNTTDESDGEGIGVEKDSRQITVK